MVIHLGWLPFINRRKRGKINGNKRSAFKQYFNSGRYLLYYLYHQKPMAWFEGRSRLHRENDKASDKRGGRGIVYREGKIAFLFLWNIFVNAFPKTGI